MFDPSNPDATIQSSSVESAQDVFVGSVPVFADEYFLNAIEFSI